MKPRERIRLINEIALKLQDEMKYNEIDMYLPSFGINCANHQPSVNSKRVYVQELLSSEKDATIIEIADDLAIKYSNQKINADLATFWEQGHFKLFISHLAKHKKQASVLQDVLKFYGISAFVAHEDIEPSREWQNEIEKALHTMEGIAVILMQGFKESNWCDQEVGFAVGKDVLIIPIKKEIDPYGFIGKYQAINGNNKTVGEVSREIFNTIVKNPKTRNNILIVFTNLIANSTHKEKVLKQLDILSEVNNIPNEILVQMSEQINNNTVLVDDIEFLKKLERLLKKYNISISDYIPDNSNKIDDDIPF
ncbi:MAG: toll/interleukin-1 receptor domain-containing protein [Sulfurovaceae bacterium]